MSKRARDTATARRAARNGDVGLELPGPRGLVVRASSLGGRGVFATRRFRAGALIEDCPLIVLGSADRRRLDRTALFAYYFDWGTGDREAAVALGFGSLYNHAYAPNAEYAYQPDRGTIAFHALRAIEAGEEITVNYNGAPDDDAPLWFPVA
jgi:SET domain-containing protein